MFQSEHSAGDPPLSPEFEALQRALAGRYSLVRELGRGGMGVVFLAREVALDRLVAIKLLPPLLASESAYRERFVREAQTAARLAHPHIVPIHAVEATGPLIWFAMEYVPGVSLGERVRTSGPLSRSEAIRVVQETAWALAHAHARGVIHRDVKPDNILLEEGTDRAMVTDFGIARREQVDDSGGHLGTPHYMSPEQVDGAPADARADIYALGVVAWVALVGRRPFEGSAGAALLAAQAGSDAPALGSVAPWLAEEVAAAIDRALRRDPDERWPTMEEFAAALEAARARQPQLPVAVRRYARQALEHSGQLGIAVGVTASAGIGALVIDAFFQTFLGFEEIPYLIVATLGVSTILLMLARHLRGIRELVASGYGREAALRGLDALEREEREVEPPLRGPAWTRHRQPVIAIGIAVTLLCLYGSTNVDSILTFAPTMTLALLTPALVIRRLAALRGERRSWWHRVLRSRRGRVLWKIATLGLGRVPERTLGGEPTAVAVGGAVQRLFETLPAAEQRLLADVPDLAARLEARAMRAGGPEATEAMVALETLRLDLMRLRAGQLDADGLTEDLAKLREVGYFVDARDEL